MSLSAIAQSLKEGKYKPARRDAGPPALLADAAAVFTNCMRVSPEGSPVYTAAAQQLAALPDLVQEILATIAAQPRKRRYESIAVFYYAILCYVHCFLWC
jgi:Bromodomain